jgi:hypothetical protein
LELVLVAERQIAGAFQVLGHAVNVKANAGECVLQPLLDQADCQVRNVDADPSPTQFLCGMNGSAATAERVQHHVTLVARRSNDAFQQGQRLLGRIQAKLLAKNYGPALVNTVNLKHILGEVQTESRDLLAASVGMSGQDRPLRLWQQAEARERGRPFH